jgi:hypothetical protein
LDYFILSPLILLLWGLFSILFKSIIPVAGGFGWDGAFYGRVAMDFPNMIGNIDSYGANRIFPGILLHYLSTILSIPLNPKSVLWEYRIYNVVILVCSSIFWVFISNRLLLKPIAKWIGFCALFINFPLLTFHFYYPALTDGTAFFISILMLYSYLEKKNILLLVVTAISFFTWPVCVVLGFLLFIYANADTSFWSYNNKRISLLFILFILLPFLALWVGLNFKQELLNIFVQLGSIGLIFKKGFISDCYLPFNYNYFINGFLGIGFIGVMYWFILKNFDFLKFFRSNFHANLLLKFFIIIIILITLMILKRLICSTSLPTFTALMYFKNYFRGLNVNFPFQFIVGQITYWGPIILLLIIFFKDFIRQLQTFSLPIMFGFLFTVIFIINSESRSIIYFYPFIVIVILKTLDFSKFRNLRLFAISFFLISLIYSKVWLPIELPSNDSPENIAYGYDHFPSQSYFMNFAYFMNFQMYLVHATVAAIFFTILYFIIKKPKQSEENGTANNSFTENSG